MKRLILVLVGLAFVVAAQAQKYRYRISLTDKNKTEYKLAKPTDFLSKRAVERRQRQGLMVDSTDLPVCSAYLKQIACRHCMVKAVSKWNNTVLVETDDTAHVIAHLKKLPFVKSYKRVWKSPEKTKALPTFESRTKNMVDTLKHFDDFYGAAQPHIELINARGLHDAGFKGKGMQIAVIDAGFYNVDVMPLLSGINILGTRDFVDPTADIYAANSHGMNVLSLMGTNKPNTYVGTAPEASYWLLRSEDSDSETPSEEDLWAAAVEFADSVGVDIVNTSLGYFAFDESEMDYRYRDLDGKTSLMTRTAARMASKGLVLCVSAGNSGNDQWHKISVPADATDVLTVGAVERKGKNAPFSSLGYTADGRVKPDVMSFGSNNSIPSNKGGIRKGSGTSFASPVLCGAVTCLWQKFPKATAYDIMDAVRRSASQYDTPDEVYGYGIPDLMKAAEILSKK